MSSLKDHLIKLGSKHPELRPHIAPVLDTINAGAQEKMASAIGERVYLDEHQAKKFGLDYYGGEGETFLIAASTLLKSKRPGETYDSRHVQLLKPLGSKTLTLENQGYGWFTIVAVR